MGQRAADVVATGQSPATGAEIAAVMVLTKGGALAVKTNASLIHTRDQQKVVAAWVRLSVLRGRRVSILTATDLGECVVPRVGSPARV